MKTNHENTPYDLPDLRGAFVVKNFLFPRFSFNKGGISVTLRPACPGISTGPVPFAGLVRVRALVSKNIIINYFRTKRC